MKVWNRWTKKNSDVQSGKFFDFLMDYLRRALNGQPMIPMDPEKAED